MRVSIFIFFVTIFSLNSFASDSTLHFRQINYSKVFELAKKENKSVMLYFHFDGCGACKKMEKNVFTNKEVADFYNSKFISFEVNTRVGEGIETNKIYNIRLHPTFLFFDKNGKEVHKIVGVFSPEEFIAQGKNTLNPKKGLTYFKKQYKDGKRDAKFLFEYCYKLNDAYELDSLMINEYLNTQKKADLFKEENIRFIYEFAVHHFDISLDINSKVFDFLISNKDKFSKYFEKEQVDTRIVWILNYAINTAIENKNEKLFNEAIGLIKEYDNGSNYIFKEIDGRTTGLFTGKNIVLSAQVDYYDKNGNTDMYNKNLKILIEKIWNDSEELNKIAWKYYEQTNVKEKLKNAIKWIIRSIELNNNYANNDTYACLLYKLGEYDKALNQAKKAIEIAKQSNVEYDETTKLIEMIEEQQKK